MQMLLCFQRQSNTKKLFHHLWLPEISLENWEARTPFFSNSNGHFHSFNNNLLCTGHTALGAGDTVMNKESPHPRGTYIPMERDSQKHILYKI